MPSLRAQLDTATAQNSELREELQRLKSEMADLQIMYDTMMEHGVAVEDQLADRNAKLERIQKRLDHELAEAAHYVQSILPSPLSGNPAADWRFVPSSELGGDSFGYHWIDNDHFAVYLIDVCGHGVGAALLSVTVMNVLRTGSLQGEEFLDPGKVLTKLNDSFDMSKQNGMYFTMWYGVFQASTRILRYSSGGHPPAILVRKKPDGNTVVATRLSTPQLVIGAMPGITYTSEQHLIPVQSRLFVFSDGTYEITTQAGADTMMSLDDFEKYLSKLYIGSTYTMDKLIFELQQIQGRELFDDDFSLVSIDFL